ncbi:hypothetical protein KSP39_PZI010162 [Platanthera zijinensis]|uniref:Uncharacterized protein n=1 Tax=Platanthera zijinensis TaxID=2320716 RepID=A0AAP0G6U8_9ASPA
MVAEIFGNVQILQERLCRFESDRMKRGSDGDRRVEGKGAKGLFGGAVSRCRRRHCVSSSPSSSSSRSRGRETHMVLNRAFLGREVRMIAIPIPANFMGAERWN